MNLFGISAAKQNVCILPVLEGHIYLYVKNHMHEHLFAITWACCLGQI